MPSFDTPRCAAIRLMLQSMQIYTLGELDDRCARPPVSLQRIGGNLAADSCPESYRQAWLLGHSEKCTDRARGTYEPVVLGSHP